MKSVHVIIEGRVQGVYFREYTMRQAKELNLKGWVKNKRNGTVEAVVAGRKKNVDSMIEWFRMGSPLSLVSGVQINELLPTEKFSGFEVRY